MEHLARSNGFQTFLEHWWFVLAAIIAVVSSQILMFFTRLSGTPWIWCFSVACVSMVVGGVLIFFAKLPVYRSGRFFTFGLKSVPERLRVLYKWGWLVFLFGVVLGFCLLLSRQ